MELYVIIIILYYVKYPSCPNLGRVLKGSMDQPFPAVGHDRDHAQGQSLAQDRVHVSLVATSPFPLLTPGFPWSCTSPPRILLFQHPQDHPSAHEARFPSNSSRSSGTCRMRFLASMRSGPRWSFARPCSLACGIMLAMQAHSRR